MKTNVAETSIEAYENLDIGAKQRRVYEALARGPKTNRELSKSLGWDINCVTPRVYELRNRELVAEFGKVKDPETNRSAKRWVVVKSDEGGQMKLF